MGCDENGTVGLKGAKEYAHLFSVDGYAACRIGLGPHAVQKNG